MTKPASERRDAALAYPIANKPEPGEAIDVAPGVRWLRMPLPFSLDHINLWLIDEGDTVCIVDTGLRGKPTEELWRRIFDSIGKPPGRLIVTHMHPDHAGSAGWLCEHYGITLHMTRSEYLMCRVLAADSAPPPEAATKHFKSAGFGEPQLERYREMFGGFGKGCGPLPPSFERLQHDDMLSIGNDDWQILCGNGHSPEHACLYQAEKNVLISGDQILPTISSNVSVWPTEPNANPLQDWLNSCRYFRNELPEDVLVLPSHGRPFYGAHERLTALIDDHESALEKLHSLCKEPRRAVDVFEALFRSRISDSNLVMATGEAIAHLNYLLSESRADTWLDDDDIRWYESI